MIRRLRRSRLAAASLGFAAIAVIVAPVSAAGADDNDTVDITFTVQANTTHGLLSLTVEPPSSPHHEMQGTIVAGNWIDGYLAKMTVNDDRPTKSGWSLTTTFGSFASGANSIEIGYLGSASGGYTDDMMPDPVIAAGVVGGPLYEPGTPETDSAQRVVATAPAGSGGGTSILTSAMSLFVPATQPAGAYHSVVSIDLVGG